MQAGNFKVVKHLPQFIIRDFINNLGIHNHPVCNNKIGHIFTN